MYKAMALSFLPDLLLLLCAAGALTATQAGAAGFPGVSPEGLRPRAPLTAGEQFSSRGLDTSGWPLQWEEVSEAELFSAACWCAAGDSSRPRKRFSKEIRNEVFRIAGCQLIHFGQQRRKKKPHTFACGFGFLTTMFGHGQVIEINFTGPTFQPVEFCNK